MNLSWLYFSLSAVGLAFTLNALRPVKWEPICVFTFFAGWFTSELPVVHIVWQAAATALFVSDGAARHWPGVAGLAVTGVSWIGLVVLEVESLRTHSIIDRALSGIDPEPAAGVPASPQIRWTESRIPVPRRHSSVERIRNIDYWGDGIPPHRLDLFRPRNLAHDSGPEPAVAGAEAVAGAPVLLYIHGGGWVIGDKREQGLPMMHHMARQGWVCITINYRLSPRATWPDHIVDCKRALAWVKENVASFGGNPDRIVVSGGSAGGHLCSLVALSANDPEFQPGFEDADTSVAGCVPFYGVYDFTNDDKVFAGGMVTMVEKLIVKSKLCESRRVFEQASPYWRIDERAPAFFIIAGSNDTLVPIREARRFHEKLRSVSKNPVHFAELPFAQHAFEIFPSVRTAQTIRGVERFLWAVATGVATGGNGALPEATGSTAPGITGGEMASE